MKKFVSMKQKKNLTNFFCFKKRGNVKFGSRWHFEDKNWCKMNSKNIHRHLVLLITKYERCIRYNRVGKWESNNFCIRFKGSNCICFLLLFNPRFKIKCEKPSYTSILLTQQVKLHTQFQRCYFKRFVLHSTMERRECEWKFFIFHQHQMSRVLKGNTGIICKTAILHLLLFFIYPASGFTPILRFSKETAKKLKTKMENKLKRKIGNRNWKEKCETN